jgi:hypothetical protein
MKGLVAAVGALALSLGLAAQASAITFNYAQLSGFVLGTELPQPDGAGDGIKFFGPNVVTVTAAINGVPAGSSTYRSIAWGSGSDAGVFPIGDEPSFVTLPGGGPNANKSGLLVVGQSGTIAPGETKVLTILNHRNSAISPPDLTQADIYSLLTITDAANVERLANRNNVRINFFETDNNPPGGLAGCNPTVQFSTTSCDDYFTFPLGSFASVVFAGGDGNDYELIFSTACVDTTETRCDIPDPNDITGTTGRIRTAEGSINELQILISLRQLTQVPAPASLLLLGLGILGAGILRRKIG